MFKIIIGFDECLRVFWISVGKGWLKLIDLNCKKTCQWKKENEYLSIWFLKKKVQDVCEQWSNIDQQWGN